jgi:hypothetical protein
MVRPRNWTAHWRGVCVLLLESCLPLREGGPAREGLCSVILFKGLFRIEFSHPCSFYCWGVFAVDAGGMHGGLTVGRLAR